MGRAEESCGIDASMRERGRASGAWVQMNSVENCDIASRAGFDFVVIDMEHGAFGIEAATHMVRAVEGGSADPVIRVSTDAPIDIRKAFEVGARAVLVPGLRSGAQARRIVSSTRFEPEGIRGACPYVRATGHGLEPWVSYLDRSQNESPVWFLIETADAVENIEEILAAGPAALVFGPFDLSMSLGLRGDTTHHDVTAALARVQQAANDAGVPTVVTIMSREADGAALEVRDWEKRGAHMFLSATDRVLLSTGYAQMAAAVSAAT